MPIKAIETKYKGFHFRSRLEARWAVFFDSLDIEWLYEHEGFELSSSWYLPDFWIPSPHYHDEVSGYWIEIKPTFPSNEELIKCKELSFESGHISLLLYGSVTLEKLDVLSFCPVRDGGKVIDVKISDTKDSDFFKKDLEPFFNHFAVAAKFLTGQKKEFSWKLLERAIINARSARF